MISKLLTMIVFSTFLTSCIAQEVYEGIYEGARTQEHLSSLPEADGGDSELQPYHLYQEQRRSRLNSEKIYSEGR